MVREWLKTMLKHGNGWKKPNGPPKHKNCYNNWKNAKKKPIKNKKRITTPA